MKTKTKSKLLVPNSNNTGSQIVYTVVNDIDQSDGRALKRGWVKWKGKSHVVALRNGIWQFDRVKWSCVPRYHKWFREKVLRSTHLKSLRHCNQKPV